MYNEKILNRMMEKAAKEEKAGKMARLYYKIWLPKKKEMLLSHQHDIVFMERMEGTFIGYEDIWDVKWNDPEFYYKNRHLLGVDAFLLWSVSATDLNENKIYDRDIVSFIDIWGSRRIGEIIFDNDLLRFGIQSKHNPFLYDLTNDCRQIKVIGNIYQNPELLKEDL